MPFVLTADQKTRVSFDARDRYGNPASIDGDPRWETSDADVLTLTTFEGGRSADIVAAGPAGTAQVTVRCDADLGDGVRELVGVLDVEVVGGEAVLLAITPAAAEPKGPAPAEPAVPVPAEPTPAVPTPAEPTEPAVPTPAAP